jgi:hypothetical protein
LYLVKLYFFIHPPCGISSLIATSRAAWSAPVGVIIAGFEKPESYHVQFFEGDEPIMDNYLGFGLVNPEDINEAIK